MAEAVKTGEQDDRGRDLWKTECSDCGEECTVPFKPTEGRPVYCKNCFRKHKRF